MKYAKDNLRVCFGIISLNAKIHQPQFTKQPLVSFKLKGKVQIMSFGFKKEEKNQDLVK